MVDKSFAFFLKRINFTQKNEAKKKNKPKSQERLAVLAVKNAMFGIKKITQKPHQFWLKENLVFVKSLNCKIYLEK